MSIVARICEFDLTQEAMDTFFKVGWNRNDSTAFYFQIEGVRTEYLKTIKCTGSSRKNRLFRPFLGSSP